MEEEGKTIDLIRPRRSENSFEAVFWQWQSGPIPDPWAEKEASKWTWQDYSHDDCLILEEAFCLSKEVADLGNYEIDLKRMLQVNKEFKNRVRRVRRQEKSRFMMEVSEPVAVVRNQKTMNQAFGTIQHFLDYIMKRTPEAFGLYQRLKTLKLDSKNHEFEDIIKEVVACIEKGAETREKIIKTRTGSQTKTFVSEATSLVNLILDQSANLGDFLKAILKAYTMETFICYWLNELLRSEDWEEINVLTPFLVCLVYTFKRSEYIIRYQEPEGLVNSLRVLVGKKKLLCLYRGAALTWEHLSLYKDQRVKYFSWNGVTSTSRDQNVAMNFIRGSLGKAQRLNEPKVGVFFVIETNFAGSEDCEGMIDVFQNACSQYPDEKEVILAPGTVFKLQKTRLIEKDIYEVSLRVKRNLGKTKENIALLGSLQDQAILKDRAIIDGLPSQQGFMLVELLKGNKLIRRIEVRNSGIEEHIMEEIENMRVTTNVKKEDIKLRDNMVVVSSLDTLAHYFSAENLNEIFLLNKVRFKEGGGVKSQEIGIETLRLSWEVLEKFKQNSQLKKLSEKIKGASGVGRLDLSIDKIEESNDQLIGFLQSVKESKCLQSLKLKVNQMVSTDNLQLLCQTIRSFSTLHLEVTLPHEGLDFLGKAIGPIVSVQNLSLSLRLPEQISDIEVDYLKSALRQIPSLHLLSLDFKKCNKVTDEGLEHLKDGLRELTSLQHLGLNFEDCRSLSNEGLGYLKAGLIPLTSLRHFSLSLNRCDKISDEGLDHLKNALVSFESLQHLSLDFTHCEKISDEGLNHLKSGLLPLISLQNLSLAFRGCREISGEGLNHLKSALLGLKSLQHLALDFSLCSKISNEGVNHLKEGLIPLTSLQHLSLDFQGCKEISGEGQDNIKNGLISLTSLRHLSLNFWSCNKISDEGLGHILGGLIVLTSLQYLSLDFALCQNVSDEGLQHLKTALIPLTSLQHLSLNFSYCEKVSDQGLHHLKSGLLPLISLQRLTISFNNCNNISDEGLSHLKSGLLPLASLQNLELRFDYCKNISGESRSLLKNALTSLHDLTLNFTYCDKISDEGLNHLKDDLISRPSLQYLSIDFTKGKLISDKGLNYLKSGLCSLVFLQHLSLNFNFCSKVSNEGLSHLKSGLSSLTSLEYLSLGFWDCNKISNDGLIHLKDGLSSLVSLQHLTLNFYICNKISDEGLNHIKSALISLTALQGLSLFFSGCKLISDKGLNNLRGGLISLTSLQSLCLNFNHCKKISDEGLNHIKSALVIRKTLQYVSLSFTRCFSISSEAIDRLRDELKFVPSLECTRELQDFD